MLCKEKYAKEIFNIACKGEKIAVKNGVPCECPTTYCDECDLNQLNSHCGSKFAEWCNSEYIEPPVDWSKVPIDTPIWVRDLENEKWTKRHFAKYEGGKVYAFGGGLTSWSQGNLLLYWKYAKLATDDELNANSILWEDRRKEE